MFIPLPELDPKIWRAVIDSRSGGLFSSDLRGISIFALSILPYVTAAVLAQLISIVSPRLRALGDEGERGRGALERYTRCGAVLFAALQAYAIAAGLEAARVASDPGFPFRLTVTLTLTGGTVFLIWLAGQITARGIGNGIAWLLIANTLADVPRGVYGVISAGRQGFLSDRQLVAMALVAIVVVIAAVAIERARRHLRVVFAQRQIGDRRIGPESIELAFKLNPGGIVPALVASWILLIIAAAAQFATFVLGLREPGGAGDWLASLAAGGPLSLALSGVVIILFAFVYTAFLHDPERLARHLDSHHGTVAELPHGTGTADHLDHTLSRLTVFGAVYLAAMMLLPVALAQWLEVPFAVGGASLLIVVCLTLDVQRQARVYLE